MDSFATTLPPHVQTLMDALVEDCEDYAARCAAIVCTGVAMCETLATQCRLRKHNYDPQAVGEYVTKDLRRTMAICETQIQDRIQAACFARLHAYPMGTWNVLTRHDDCTVKCVRSDPDYDSEYDVYFEDFANREFSRMLLEVYFKMEAAVAVRDQQFMLLAEKVFPGAPPRSAHWCDS